MLPLGRISFIKKEEPLGGGGVCATLLGRVNNNSDPPPTPLLPWECGVVGGQSLHRSVVFRDIFLRHPCALGSLGKPQQLHRVVVIADEELCYLTPATAVAMHTQKNTVEK